MNLWEFHARVFSLTGGGKKFRTGAGGLGLQSIVMELLLNFASELLSTLFQRCWKALGCVQASHAHRRKASQVLLPLLVSLHI